MMFQGTYTSDFYRAIRDLLHEQVSLHTRAGAAENGTGHYHAKQALERRWQALIAREEQYRSHDDAPGSSA